MVAGERRSRKTLSAIMEKNEFNVEVLFFPVKKKPAALYSSSEHNGMGEELNSYSKVGNKIKF